RGGASEDDARQRQAGVAAHVLVPVRQRSGEIGRQRRPDVGGGEQEVLGQPLVGRVAIMAGKQERRRRQRTSSIAASTPESRPSALSPRSGGARRISIRRGANVVSARPAKATQKVRS